MNYKEEVKYKTNNNIEMLLTKFIPNKWNFLVRILAQIVHNTRPKTEEQMLIVMDQSTHEEHLSQPLQTNNKQFKIAVTFLTGYNGIFIVKSSINKFYFKKSFVRGDDFFQNTIPPGDLKLEV